jgi:hypothetical protein
MPANTPIRGLPYPVDTDPIDTAGDIQRLAVAADIDGVPVFATTAERDAAIPAPIIGQVCFCADQAGGAGELMRYHVIGGVPMWRPMQFFTDLAHFGRVQTDGQYANGQIVVEALAGSTFPMPQIAFHDMASPNAVSVKMGLWSNAGTSHTMEFHKGDMSAHIALAAGAFNVVVVAGDMPDLFTDLETNVDGPTGPEVRVDIAALAMRLAGRVAAQQTFITDLVSALQAVLDPANPATASSLTDLLAGES